MTYYLHNNGVIREGSACPGEGLYCKPRPIAVIDLEPHQAEFVIHVLEQTRHSWTLKVADALRNLATPPKPDEPTGLGAVVEDEKGLTWVRRHPGGEAWVNGYQRWATYDEINAVRILSEGVQPC